MKQKSIDMIKLLMGEPSTAKRLADTLDVSVRSIKNYVKEINEQYKGTIESSQKGYSIDRTKGLEILENIDKSIPQTSNERAYHIIAKLLHSYDANSLNLYDLCEELFVSSSTIKNDLITVKRWVNKFDLILKTKGDWIKIEGSEKNKRKILSNMIYEESSINFVNLDSLQKVFHNLDIFFIKDTLMFVLNKHQYFTNDYSLINLVLHVAIAISRINNIHSDTASQNSILKKLSFNEIKIAEEITEILGKEFNIEFDNNELNALALLIASRATSLDYETITKNNIGNYVGDECVALVDHLVKTIHAFYDIDLLDDDFLVRFTLHIRNLLIRSANNQYSKNPLAEGLRRSCPTLYEVSVKVASELKKVANITIDDDEIAYIAFHIGSSLENSESLKDKLKTVYYCPNYYTIQDKVLEFVNKHFHEEIVITSIISDESQLENQQSDDLILTTVPIQKHVLTPVVQVTIMVNDYDKKLLSDVVFKIRNRKKEAQFREHLQELVRPDLFVINNDITNKEKCIHFMSHTLIEKGYANPEFTHEVFEREQMSSTSFFGTAIPHSMHMNAHKTGISILISKEGIEWEDSKVHLVLMMCFNKKDRSIFNNIFEPVSMILAERENLNKLISTDSYEAFVDMMVSLLP